MGYSWHDFHCNSKMQKLNTQSSLDLTWLPRCVWVSESEHAPQSGPKGCLITRSPQPLCLKRTHVTRDSVYCRHFGNALGGVAIRPRCLSCCGLCLGPHSLILCIVGADSQHLHLLFFQRVSLCCLGRISRLP